MMVRVFSIFILVSFLPAQGVYAEEMKVQLENLTLNANRDLYAEDLVERAIEFINE